MFFSHIPELMLVLVGALIVFGPKRLPEIGASLGKGIKDFKKGMHDMTDEMHTSTLPKPEDHS